MLKNKKGVVTEIQHDEHLRPETTLEQLRGLKAPFRANGVITAGNASGVNDGAAALIIASEQMAAAQGLTPRARIVAMGNCRGGTAPDGAWSGACNSPGAGTRGAEYSRYGRD